MGPFDLKSAAIPTEPSELCEHGLSYQCHNIPMEISQILLNLCIYENRCLCQGERGGWGRGVGGMQEWSRSSCSCLTRPGLFCKSHVWSILNGLILNKLMQMPVHCRKGRRE